MNNIDVIKNKIKELIIQTFNLEIPLEEIADDMMIFNGGLYLDSVALIQLIITLEKEFEICFDDENILLEKSNSIIALANYVSEKMRTA